MIFHIFPISVKSTIIHLLASIKKLSITLEFPISSPSSPSNYMSTCIPRVLSLSSFSLSFSDFIFYKSCLILLWFSHTRYLLLLSHSVMSNSLQPHGLQHYRHPCPLPSSRGCSKSCPLSHMMPSNRCILCHPLLLLPSIFPSIRVFSNESALQIR